MAPGVKVGSALPLALIAKVGSATQEEDVGAVCRVTRSRTSVQADQTAVARCDHWPNVDVVLFKRGFWIN